MSNSIESINGNGHEFCRSEIDGLRQIAKDQEVVIDRLIRGECLGTVNGAYIACGERNTAPGIYDKAMYCSAICQLRAERRIT